MRISIIFLLSWFSIASLNALESKMHSSIPEAWGGHDFSPQNSDDEGEDLVALHDSTNALHATLDRKKAFELLKNCLCNYQKNKKLTDVIVYSEGKSEPFQIKNNHTSGCFLILNPRGAPLYLQDETGCISCLDDRSTYCYQDERIWESLCQDFLRACHHYTGRVPIDMTHELGTVMLRVYKISDGHVRMWRPFKTGNGEATSTSSSLLSWDTHIQAEVERYHDAALQARQIVEMVVQKYFGIESLISSKVTIPSWKQHYKFGLFLFVDAAGRPDFFYAPHQQYQMMHSRVVKKADMSLWKKVIDELFTLIQVKKYQDQGDTETGEYSGTWYVVLNVNDQELLVPQPLATWID